jgi:putative two-component system response regulator
MQVVGSGDGAGRQRSIVVLVVDSDEHARFIYRSMLLHHGYDVVTVSDGPTGLQVCDASPPNVIVIDVDPPTCPSLDVVRALAEHPRYRGRTIAMTRRAMHHEQPALRAIHFAALLIKPVDPKLVVNAVRGAFGIAD